MIDIRGFDPKTASRAEWDAVHTFRHLRMEEDHPGEPLDPDADFEADLRRDWPLWESRRLMAWRDDVILGNCLHQFRRAGSPDADQHAAYVNLRGGVLTPARRQGIATELLHATLPLIDAMGKTVISINTRVLDGHEFAAAFGFEEKYRSTENRLDLDGLDWDMVSAWQGNGSAAGLRWEVHRGRAPLARLEALYPQLTDLMRTVPLGALDTPPLNYEIESTRAWYEAMERYGGAHHLVMLMAGETVAGICEASQDARCPDRVFQALTAVSPGWRGRGLAKMVKAEMLLLIRRAHPQARWVITSNATENAPMLSINQRLGFRPHLRESTWQISRDALGRSLAT